VAQWVTPELVGHISRDATAIEGREKPTAGPSPPKPAPREKGRPRRGEVREPKPETRLERQCRQSAPEAVAFGQVWVVDFVEDKLVSGRKLRILNVLDIFSRYALGSLVEHSITGALAARHLEALFLRYGAPQVLRRDHGPEFESRVFKKGLMASRVKDEPVPKAQPYDNGHLESFNGSLRNELLDAELFYALGEARAKVESWLHWYNGERPHQSLGYQTPLEVWATTAPLGAPVATLPPPPEGLLGNLSHGCFKPTLS
ncbi:MAG: integrase core domain-containing protein, partial [Deltaproteobacteria bacterium]|nr:integrase core domain-containing protein [Deltaproteobacteria bacterium]